MSATDGLKFYMRDISEIPLITQEEEVELARRIHQGDDEARLKLIRSNLRLVVKIAHDFKGMGFSLQDLVSEGNVGLMRAAEKFDPDKGAKFSSYAAWWIKQAMRRGLSEKSKTIRIPVASVGKIHKIRNARSQLTHELGREPTDKEVGAKLDFSERVISRLRQADFKTISLQDSINRGEEGEIANLIPDENSLTPLHMLEGSESTHRLNILLERLDAREKAILKMRYGLDGNPPRTLEQISRSIGRTRERVRQIQKRALNKLRRQIDQDVALPEVGEKDEPVGAKSAVLN
jgi:RNA polymerase primary sigma factor